MLKDRYGRPYRPYVILLGDAGTGKSTIVEKMTGKSSRSRNADSSVSNKRSSEILWVPDGSLVIADTPGMNWNALPLEDALESNTWITSAINFGHISRIFIVVKAEANMDNVISNVRKYAYCFARLSDDVLAVLVTQMDIPYLEWTKETLTYKLRSTVGISTVVFSAKDTTGETLVWDILDACSWEYAIPMDSKNLSKLLQRVRILKSISNEVANFQAKKNAFDEARKDFSGENVIF